MADTASTVDAAARTAENVAAQAANGNVWAFWMFLVAVVAALIALWIWRSTGAKPASDDHDDDPDPSCKPSPDGCPSIQILAARIDVLTKQLDDDRQERRDHRTYVEDVVRGVHARIDTILLSAKVRAV